jgi:superfamily II DNA or RNA helicase
MKNIYDSLLRVSADNIKSLPELCKILTVKNSDFALSKKRNRFTQAQEEFLFFELDEAKRQVLIPRNIPDSYFKNPEKEVFTSSGVSVNKGIAPNFALWDYQEQYLGGANGIYQMIKKGASDLVYLIQCGDGKTICGLHTAYTLQKNAIIIVPTHQLATQWINAIKEFFPEWTYGMYDDKKKEIFDFTITTYDLMADKKFDMDFFRQFGITLFDEVHRVGASTYAAVLSKTCTEYRISLTATFRRKDGTHTVLEYHCGKIVPLIRPRKKAHVVPLLTGISLNLKKYRLRDKRCTPFAQLAEYEEVWWRAGDVDVLILDKKKLFGGWQMIVQEVITTTQHTLSENEAGRLYRYQGISMAGIDTAVSEDPERIMLLFELIKACYERGRSPIVLSKRKELLYTLSDMLLDAGITDVGVICSKKAKDWQAYVKEKFSVTNFDEYEEQALTKRIILGIDRLAKEGMDVKSADTLIMAHPDKDPEQAVGRILREKFGKKDALCFYLLDAIAPYQNFYHAPDGAKKMFKKLEHTILPEMTFEQFKSKFYI